MNAGAARILSRLFMFVLTIPLPAGAATSLPDGRLRWLTEGFIVTLHVTNYAAISPKDLAAAEAYAAAIYRVAGIETVWTETPWAPGETGSPHLRVVILSPEMTARKCKGTQLGANLMGTAIDGATDGSGRIAYVFAERIGQAAFKYVANFERGLGHVMAHEVGHLLLGGHSHAPTGLMAADWNPLDMRLQTLTPEQAKVIRARAMATEGIRRHPPPGL